MLHISKLSSRMAWHFWPALHHKFYQVYRLVWNIVWTFLRVQNITRKHELQEIMIHLHNLAFKWLDSCIIWKHICVDRFVKYLPGCFNSKLCTLNSSSKFGSRPESYYFLQNAIDQMGILTNGNFEKLFDMKKQSTYQTFRSIYVLLARKIWNSSSMFSPNRIKFSCWLHIEKYKIKLET